jgi:hypothetical protein
LYLRVPKLAIMKAIFILPLITLNSFFEPSIHYSTIIQTDTTSIIHSLDGNISEWPSEKFISDKEIKTRFATDNDVQFLFLALYNSRSYYTKENNGRAELIYMLILKERKKNVGIEFPVAKQSRNNEAFWIFRFRTCYIKYKIRSGQLILLFPGIVLMFEYRI